MLVGKLNCQE